MKKIITKLFGKKEKVTKTVNTETPKAIEICFWCDRMIKEGMETGVVNKKNVHKTCEEQYNEINNLE